MLPVTLRAATEEAEERKEKEETLLRRQETVVNIGTRDGGGKKRKEGEKRDRRRLLLISCLSHPTEAQEKRGRNDYTACFTSLLSATGKTTLPRFLSSSSSSSRESEISVGITHETLGAGRKNGGFSFSPLGLVRVVPILLSIRPLCAQE